MWMGGEEAQQGSQQSDILPNADGTWYLQIFLDVEATKTSGLSCRVRHSSLEGQDIILYMGKKKLWSTLGIGVDGPSRAKEPNKKFGIYRLQTQRMNVI